MPVRLEELVEIELVELPGARDRQQFVRHLVGQQAHLRQRAVGVPLAGVLGGELFLGALLVGVGPVEDLLLDELARGQRLERRAGEVEVRLGRDGQELGLLLRKHAEVFVHIFQAGGVFELGLLLRDRLFLALEQFLRGLPPRAEVVFVEHHEVPLHLVQPFVLRLDVSRRVAAEQVLEGAEIDDRLLADRSCVGIAVGVAREVLPAVEVHMGFEVRLPRILDRGLEGHHEHALGAELLGELVGGEGLAEAHLRVPEEARDGVHVLLPDASGSRRASCFTASACSRRIAKRLVMRAGEPLPRAQFGEHGLHVLDRAAHPFQFGVRELLPDERRAHLVVGEDGAVVALGGFVQFDLVVLDGGGLELLGDALLHVARGLPDLEETLVRLVVDRVGVDARPRFRLGREDFLDGLTHRHLVVRSSTGSCYRDRNLRSQSL